MADLAARHNTTNGAPMTEHDAKAREDSEEFDATISLSKSAVVLAIAFEHAANDERTGGAA